MKQLLTFILALVSCVSYGQTIGYLRYDSVKMAKNGGNTELILENATKSVTGGVLTNTGNGRTAFVLGSGGWSLTGNASTTPGTNFLGTTDAQDLVFKTNAAEVLRLLTSGAIRAPEYGAGTFTGTPTYSLQVDASGNVIEGAVAVSGANTALSNLASVAINTSLLPGTTDAIDLGSSSKQWRNIYLPNTSSSTTGVIFKAGGRFIHNFALAGTSGDNTFLGVSAGNFTMTGSTGIQGSFNVGVGASALASNTTGYRNSAVGTYALQNNTTGLNNTSFGAVSLFTNTTGFNNTAVGVRAVAFGNGENIVAIGVDAASRNSAAAFNVAVGTDALYNIWNGQYSVAVGDSTLWVDSTSFKNTAVGSRAGYYTGGDYATRHDSLATFLGADASRDNSVSGDVALNNITAIGYNAKVFASNQVVLGNNDVTSTLFKGAMNNRNYGAGTYTGTPTYALQVDVDGNIIEGSVGGSAALTATYVGYGDGSLTGEAAFTYDATNNELGITGAANGRGFLVKGAAATYAVVMGASATLYLQDNSGIGVALSMNSSYDFSVNTVGYGTARILIPQATGYVGIANASPGANLDVTGTMWASGAVKFSNYGAGAATFDASGNISSVSDERMKTDIRPYKTGLKELLKINPIQYKWNEVSGLEMNSTYAGFSAQNVKENIPFATGENKDGYLSLQDRAIMAALVNAVKEQQKEIDKLKKEIKKLKRK